MFRYCGHIEASPLLIYSTVSEHGPIAQRSELPAHNRRVPGSNPGWPMGISSSVIPPLPLSFP